MTDQKAERVQLRAALGLSELLKSRQKVLVYITLIYFFKLTTWLQQIWGKKNEYSASAAEPKNSREKWHMSHCNELVLFLSKQDAG